MLVDFVHTERLFCPRNVNLFFKKLQLITNCHETKLFAKRTKTGKSYGYVPCAGEFSPGVVMRWHFFRPCALKHPAARNDIGISFNKTSRLV